MKLHVSNDFFPSKSRMSEAAILKCRPLNISIFWAGRLFNNFDIMCLNRSTLHSYFCIGTISVLKKCSTGNLLLIFRTISLP